MDIIQKNKVNPEDTFPVYDNATGTVKVYSLATGELVAENGIFAEDRGLLPSVSAFEAIANLVREGKSLSKIAEMETMPSLHLMYRWKRKYPEFSKLLREAREDRADYFMEIAENEVTAALTTEDVKVAKVKFDAFTSLAEKYNSKDYGKQAEKASGGSGPVQIVVHTGVPSAQSDYVTIETKEIVDEKS